MPKVKVEKIIKANREKIFNLVTDFENLPNRFPQFFKSVKVLSKEGNTITTEDHAVMAGREMQQTTKHILTPPEIDEVYLLSGDAKDSHIITKYESIPDGTKITVEGDFKLAGKLKLVGFMAKGKIEKGLEEVMQEFAKVAEGS
ncbi:Polyketide cyclase / dehydrase and lipid transport [uncultured archaeon]|nr:Polyketide cyclase / dehydrase and lipid transport [uncultured archaeon]